MNINSSDIFLIGINFIIIFFSAFSLFLPCVLVWGKNFAVKFAVPLSIAIEIIIGYFFYSANLLRFFPATYFALIIVINTLAVLVLLRNKKIQLKKILSSITLSRVLSFILLLIPILYTRYYYSLTNIAAGNEDSYGHISFLNQLLEHGYIQQAYYAPGFHLFLYPLTSFLDVSQIYRFAGPAIGLLILLSFFLLFKDIFRSNLSKIIFVLLFCAPVFNGLILTTIGFWSTVLSFFFIAILVYIASKPKPFSDKTLILVYLIITIASSISVPYIFIQFIPVIFIIYFVSNFVFSKSIYQAFLKKLFLISATGLILAFGHVYFQTKIINRGGGFPQVSITNYSDNISFLILRERYDGLNSSNPFINNYIFPIYNNGIEIISPKMVRLPWQLVSIKTYVWVVASLIFLLLSMKKRKNKFIYSFFLFNLLFGLIQITGIFESTLYRGRIGFYFLFFSVLGVTYIFDYINRKKIIALALIVILFTYSLVNPPAFQHGYCVDPINFVYNELNKNPNQQLIVLSNQDRIRVLSDRIMSYPLLPKYLDLQSENNLIYIIVDKKLCYTPPSKEEIDTDVNLKLFNNDYYGNLQKLYEINRDLKSSKSFSSYKLLRENDNIEIYQRNN